MKDQLQKLLEKLANRFDALAMRERILLWGSALTLILLAWYSSLMEPVVMRYRNVSALMAAASTEAGTDADGNPVSELADASALLEQVNNTRALVRRYDLQLSTASTGLITPTEMNEVIHELLRRHSAVKLVSLTNQPTLELPAPVVAATGTDTVETDGDAETIDTQPLAQNSGVFMHPVQITVDGQFSDILTYLHALEDSHWQFDWQSFELSTQTYPTSRARIDINTLSLDRNLLGL